MSAKLAAEDRLAIYEVIALGVHINDSIRDNPDAAHQLNLVFAEDISWEGHHGSDIEHLDGLEAVVPRYAQAVDLPFLVDHHAESTIVTSVVDGQVRTRTHFMAVRDDAVPVSGDYLDVLERTDEGWRIVERKIVNRILGPDSERSSPDVYAGWEIV